MTGEGQGSKGQMATVNRHIYREISSIFTSSSGVLSYDGLWYSGNTNSAHAALWTVNKYLTGRHAIRGS